MEMSFFDGRLEKRYLFESQGEGTPGILACALSEDSDQITKLMPDLENSRFNTML